MPTLAQYKAYADDKLVNIVKPFVDQKQDAFFAKHGRYFTLQRPVVALPEDMAEVEIPPRFQDGEATNVDIKIVNFTEMPFAIYVHGEEKNGEHDYTIYVEARVKGKRYRRQHSRFNKLGKRTDWEQFINDDFNG